jgi:hypothetical protein
MFFSFQGRLPSRGDVLASSGDSLNEGCLQGKRLSFFFSIRCYKWIGSRLKEIRKVSLVWVDFEMYVALLSPRKSIESSVVE